MLYERYLAHLRVHKRLAARTLEIYARALQQLEQLATPLDLALEDLQNVHLRGFAAKLHSQGLSPKTIAQTLSAWRGFYGWLGRERQLTHNPCLNLKVPKKSKPLPKALSLQEGMQFAAYRAPPEAKPEASALNTRDAAMIELFYSSGLRVAELVGLDQRASANAKGWVDMQEKLVHVFGKASKWRSVPVGKHALAALAQWQTLRAQNPKNQQQAALFTGRNGTRLSTQAVWQRLRLHSIQAGLGKPVHPHMLRHSFASHMLQASQDLRAVQEMLGHASVASTQVYTRLDFEHLAAIYTKAHPRAGKK